MDCHNSAGSNNGIHCVFVGPDRLFYHYEINHVAAVDIPVVKKWAYKMYKDYQADDIQIGSQYIIMKAHSLDDNDHTVLTYRRQDLGSRPGEGFLWGAFNGTEYADVEWDKVQVQMAEWSGGHKFYVQKREDTGADIYDIGNLRVNVLNGDWERGQTNCIQFDRSENSKCVPVGDVWYREVPNHPGPPEKYDPDNYKLWRILGWIAAGLILLAVLAIVIKLLTASAKPGMGKGAQSEYYENGAQSRGTRVVEEETTTVRGSTQRGLTQYEDVQEVQYSNNNAVSQEEMYGDYSSMPYRESKIVYG